MAEPEVFVSYAREDREVAEGIARGLTELGIPTFFDRFSFRVGDSVIESVQRGLSGARFGVVIVSPDSLEKHWPRDEVKQLMRGHIEGRKRILPVWHNVSPEQVMEAQPGLEEIWGVSSEDGLRAIVRALAAQIAAATVAVVPVDQRPLQRFLNGDGELSLEIEGPSFTIWEAVLKLSSDMFPLYVDGEMLDRTNLLTRASEAMARPPGLATPLDEQVRAAVEEVCGRELRLDAGALETERQG